MVFEMWQLVIAVIGLLVGVFTIVLKLGDRQIAKFKELEDKQTSQLIQLEASSNARMMTLEGRHQRLSDRHFDHTKEVADKYAKKIYVNEAVTALEKQITPRLDLVIRLLNGGKDD